jgi:hypothetical protein
VTDGRRALTEAEALAARPEPPYSSDERTMLEAWLDYHRATLLWKCAGLTDDQLCERSVPPSSMSLHGLVRHLAEAERYWFERVLLGLDTPLKYWLEGNPDGDFDDVDSADPDADVQDLVDACAAARTSAASVESLDSIAVKAYPDRPVSLRWILVHMVEEYARHNRHADLLRERLDGAVGD